MTTSEHEKWPNPFISKGLRENGGRKIRLKPWPPASAAPAGQAMRDLLTWGEDLSRAGLGPTRCAYGHLHAVVQDALAVSWMCGDQSSLAGLLFPSRFLIRFHGEMDLREGDLG